MITRFPKQDLPPSRNGKDAALYAPWPESPKREAPSIKQIHTVFSASGSLYQRWQADLLAYSHRKANQVGLLSSNEESSLFAGQTFQTPPYSPHPLSGDDYTPYNKPKALKDWLEKFPPLEEVVLILDPDCVFLEPLGGEEEVSGGRAVAHPMSYLDPAHEHNIAFVKKHCSNPEAAQAVGIPILIHRDDLAALAPRWLRKTEEIREDPESRKHAGWVAEMWAYAFAAAEIELEHSVRELSRVPTDDKADLALIHYCYPSSDPKNRWRWDKWGYRPWKRVPDPPGEVPLASRVLIRLLNEYAALPKHQICLY